MSLIEALKKNPDAKPSELPYKDWPGLKNGLCEELVLNDDEPFLVQMVKVQYTDGFCSWNPYDEGYGDGPSNLKDSWRKGYFTSIGGFMGEVAEEATPVDALDAEIKCVAMDCEDKIDTVALMKAVDEWKGPRSQDEREQDHANQIIDLFNDLSDGAKAKVIKAITQG